MVEPALSRLVKTLIADERLPRSGADGLLAKYGDGTTCSVCQKAVGGSAVMYLLSFGSGQEQRKLAMDFTCFMAWDGERSGIRAQSTSIRRQTVS
jgi:hypothetical protein